MEVNRAESAAVAAVGGVPADVLDTAGRLVVTPNALTLDGQRNVPADLQPGESLASFLDRHVPGIDSGAWTVMIGGAVVPQAMWVHTFPKHGQLIACRAVLRKSALQLVAIAALSYFTMGAGAGWIAGSFGVSAGVAGAIGLGMFMAGSVLINKVLAPKIPSAQSLAQKQIYSLSDQRNTARPYEPIPVLWGEMRVTPDLASKSYAWYEGDDQYMSTILLGGINVQEAFDLAIGDTPIGNFSDVGLYFNGFPGMPSQNVPLYSNVDAVAGAEFVNGGDWITRTGSAGAAALQVDIEGQLYAVYSKSGVGANSVGLTIQARKVGASSWNTMLETTLSNASQDALRRTYSFDVAPGQYEVRAKLGVPHWTDPQDMCRMSWVSLKSVQADTTDYSQWGRIGIKIRASGQLSGSLDQVRATYRAKPMPIWTGTGWDTATTRADGLSNPGAILLQTLRGVWVTDTQGQRVLQFGFGLSDEQIDIEGLKAFMLHCAARGYTYDKWITSSMSLGAFCEEVALAGMGEFAWTDGSRPTAVFVTSGQPNSAVVNMANMLKGGFSVDYALSNAADGIEYQWLNRDTWEMTTLRVMAPGVTTMLSPARVTGEGITSEAHAAVMARYHLAQSLYQYKTVHYTADIEHLDYRRLSVLSVSHDLTQWGFGGRVMAAKRIGAQVQLTLDEPVPALASAYIGLRVPGARDYRVWPVQPLAAESDVVTLVGEWPADLDFPGEGIGNPAHDTLWCYDFKATPGYRVRVTGIDPESDLKGARITAVPEGPEFWDYVLNGTYVPAPNQSSIPQLGRPIVKNLRVSEKVNLQGDTEWYELSCVWDVEGDCDHAQVWAGRDGSELRMVDGNAQGARSTFRIDGAGEWLIVVRPFNANGQAGQSAEKLYITTMTQLPPRNPGTFVVQQVEGGLRRFAWMYAGERPAAFAGVQIRYLPGDVPLSVADWETMQPLGTADDVYTAHFVTTKPDAGQWTFGLRAVDTAGQLANGVTRVVAVLDTVFDNLVSPDLTPPPAPTGLDVSTSLASIHLGWDQPTYTVGHGPQFTRVYAVQVTTEAPAPGRAQAEIAAEIIGPVGSIARALGTTWRLWFVNVSNDGVESVDAGPVDVTVGKIGNTDLGPLIVEAGNLANGAVSANKLAAQAVDTTKFANGIEPVTNSTAGTLPTVKSTTTITWQGKLYRWDGAKYTAAVPTTDLTGTIIASQIAAGAVDVTKFASGIEPVTNSTAGTLPTVKSTTVITWQGKLYRWDGSKYSAEVAAVDLTGQIDSAKLADNAVTVSKIAAGAVDAGKLATGAVTAAKIAAAAVDATKFASGIEPVTISAAASLPTVKSTTVITWQGKLYRWDGAKYTTATAAADVTGQLTDAQLAAISAAKLTGQITGTQITDGAISTPKIAAGAVSANQIAAGAVVADKLAANAVTAAAVAAGAITTAKLAANAVTANELAANAVIAGKIAAGAVSADQIAAGAITASKLLVANTANIYPDFDCVDLNFYTAVAGTFSLTGSGVAANGRNIVNIAPSPAYSEVVSGWFSIESLADYSIKSRISLESVDAATLAEQYIEFATYVGANISNPTITRRVLVGASSSNSATPFVAQVTAAGSERLARMVFTRAAGGTARGYIGAPNMVRMASGNLIVDGAITAAKIAAKTITAAEIAAGTITAAELGAGSVTAGKIAAGTVTANELATNSVTAVKIAAGAVTAGKIAANAVTANEIAANSVTTAKIAAGAVSATEIAAATILASKLVISDQSNMLADSEFLDTTGYWNLSTAELSTDAAAVAALNCTPVIVNRAGTTARFDVFNRNSTVYMSVEPGKTYRLSIQCFVKAGWNGRAQLNAQGFLSNGTTGSTAANSYGIDYRVTAVAVDTTFTLTLDYTASSTTSFLRFRILADFTDAAVAGLFVGRPRVWLKQDADLIVDGAIVAAKLATGSVTANAIAANSVTTNAIAANAVTANEIAANAVTTAQIAAGAVKADQIAAGAITARQLVVADFANLVPDPDFANLGSGSGDGSWYVVGTTVGTIARYAGAEGAGVLLTKYAGQTAEISARSENWRNNTPENFVPVKEGDKLRVQCVVTRKAGASGGNIGLYADMLSSDGVSSGTSVSGVAGNTPLEVQQEVSGEYTVPAGVVGIRFRIYYGTSAASAGGSVAVTKISVRRMNTAELIVDGAITASKIAANAIAVGSAAIQDGAIVNAMIGNAAIDNAKIANVSAAKLTAGALSVGSYINSSNYISGSQGWSINANGQAEFSGVIVRGTIYSSAGTIGGITINGNGLNSGGFWGYVWPPAGQSGFHIGPYGILLGNANNGRYVEIQASGNIYAPGLSIENGNATFSGNLSGASGSFSGILTAQRVISMENLDYNIATVAVGVTAGDQVSPINGEILGVTAPAADWSATYIVSFHADVRAGSRGVLQIQVDGGTQFEFSMTEGGMKSFGFTFSGNGLARRVRLYVAGNNSAPVSSVVARSISVIVSKR